MRTSFGNPCRVADSRCTGEIQMSGFGRSQPSRPGCAFAAPPRSARGARASTSLRATRRTGRPDRVEELVELLQRVAEQGNLVVDRGARLPRELLARARAQLGEIPRRIGAQLAQLA